MVTKKKKPVKKKPTGKIQIKKRPGAATVAVTNILTQHVQHASGTIAPGKSGKVTPYEAELFVRKKHVCLKG